MVAVLSVDICHSSHHSYPELHAHYLGKAKLRIFFEGEGRGQVPGHRQNSFLHAVSSVCCAHKFLKNKDKGASKCYFPAFLGNYDRPTNQPILHRPTDQTTNRWTGGDIES